MNSIVIQFIGETDSGQFLDPVFALFGSLALCFWACVAAQRQMIHTHAFCLQVAPKGLENEASVQPVQLQRALHLGIINHLLN